MRIYVSLCCLAACLTLAGSVMPATTPDTPKGLFQAYLDALIQEKWDEAKSLWIPGDIAQAERLGITYADIRPKYDCASPVVRSLPSIRDGSIKVVVDTVIEHEGLYEIRVHMPLPDEVITTSYYAVRAVDGLRLVSPLTYFAQQWDTLSTTYARIYCEDKARLNKYALEALDQFVEETANALGMSDADLENLRQKKILYYLCSEERVVELTGHPVHGMYDIPSDAIISCHLPHKHEMVHLLANYTIRELPLYTALFLQEGLACHLGGRWERSPATIAYGGYAIFKYALAPLDDVLTFRGFTETIGTPDIAYPMSALLVGYLMEQAGAEKSKELYLALSGSARAVESYSGDYVRSTVSKYTGIPWDQIAAGFENWWKADSLCYISPVEGPLPGTTTKQSFDLAEVTIGETETDYIFHIAMKSENSGIFIAVTDPASKVESEYETRIFERYVPGSKYTGQRFGFRLSPEEIAAYDLFNDELVASYILSFSRPLESSADGCWLPDSRSYSFAVAKDIFGGMDVNAANVRLFAM